MTLDQFNKLVKELSDLNTLIQNGQTFIQSDAFNELDDMNKDLLIAQINAMSSYGAILSIRCHLNIPQELKDEINNKNADAEARREIPEYIPKAEDVEGD